MISNRPNFIRREIIVNTYDGIDDDLLTGGFGKEGLMRPAPPAFDDPEHPAARELRSHAIFFNYRGLMDLTPDGGYGRFYGPGVLPDGSQAEGDGMIAGKEYLAYADDGTGQENVALVVQIPNTFDPENACIVAAPSSGSRGVYGAIGVVGEWALKRGFAVAYTDKGTGIGVHDLDTDTVNTLTGERMDRKAAGPDTHFAAPEEDGELDAYRRQYPHRIAFKHAHSRRNPEKDWGQYVLASLRFAFHVLNLPENYGRTEENAETVATLSPENTLVIASGISNGGSAAIRAAEQDTEGLIHGVAVSEPNVNPVPDESLVIQQGEWSWRFPDHSRSLLDYQTLLNLYQPVANLAPEMAAAPFNLVDRVLCEHRSRALADRGLLSATTLPDQAAEARKIINDAGLLEEQNLLQPAHYGFSISQGIAVTYAAAYGRFGVTDNLCGYSFAGLDDRLQPGPLTPARLAGLFVSASGIPPTPPVPLTPAQMESLRAFNPALSPPTLPVGLVEIISNDAGDGPGINRYSADVAGVQDMNLTGALRLRRLATGKDEAGNPLTGDELAQHRRVREGMEAVRATGSLAGRPALIVHGRADAILPPNHTSRAYFGLNRKVEGADSRLQYYEVPHAHHMDAFNAFPGFNALFVPLHVYLVQALDLLYAHLRDETPLPPSQVVRTRPRGMDPDGNVLPLTSDHIPPIVSEPGADDRIVYREGTLRIPD